MIKSEFRFFHAECQECSWQTPQAMDIGAATRYKKAAQDHNEAKNHKIHLVETRTYEKAPW